MRAYSSVITGVGVLITKPRAAQCPALRVADPSKLIHMVTQDQLTRSKQIQKHTGRTFHVATRFLPEQIRHATYVLYAFFRMADQVVDDPDPMPTDVQMAELQRIRLGATGAVDTWDPILKGFSEVRDEFQIPDSEVHAFIDAMERDIGQSPEPEVMFAHRDEMTQYLRGSAVAVAHMMLAVMDPENPERARPHAKALGEAFQLTNFLRDVREDIEDYNRVYLPQATLDRFGVAIETIEEGRVTSALRSAIQSELQHAEGRYRSGVAGIRYLPKGCQFPVLLAAIFYAEYHRIIRRQRYDVQTSVPSLSLGRYVSLFIRARWHWFRTTDPERVFYRVSPIEPDVRSSSRVEQSLADTTMPGSFDGAHDR